MSTRAQVAFLLSVIAVAAAITAVGSKQRDAHSAGLAHYTRDIAFPHATSCTIGKTDRVTEPPCQAARDLLLGANSGDPELYCKVYAPRREFGVCRAGVAFSDPGFAEFQTVDYRVRSARLLVDGVAIVRVHVWPFSDGGPPGDMLLVLERESGWYHVVGYQAAPPPSVS